MRRIMPAWLKSATDMGPLLVFFGFYMASGLMAATAGLMAVTIVAVVVVFVWERRIALMPLITAVVVGIFGGLTLWFDNDIFIKLKPTIVQGIVALVLFGGLVFKRPLLKPMMGGAWPMDDTGWHKLTYRFAWFFTAMAGLNEVVWRTQSTDLWVTYKVFGIMALTAAFMGTQWPLLNRHYLKDESAPD